MKLEIVSKRSNPPLKREELKLACVHEGKPTPSRAALLLATSKLVDVNQDLVIVDRIITKKGGGHSELTVLVYTKKEDIPEGKQEKMI